MTSHDVSVPFPDLLDGTEDQLILIRGFLPRGMAARIFPPLSPLFGRLERNVVMSCGTKCWRSFQ